ncbi:MAG: hypothetical protein K9K67_07255 [Bacteriovoracaceae bacterium]|nr:hypothetical protein [Bacteriovoracaceae bacterium]
MKNTVFLMVNISTSLTSLFFYLLTVKEVSQISGEETFFQSIGLGLYLLFMGIGAYFFKVNKSYDQNINQLIKLEWGALFSGATAPILMYLYLFIATAKGFYAPVSPQDIGLIPVALVTLVTICSLGLFTGGQLPIFLKIGSESKNVVLFANYLGALMAGPVLNYLINLQLNLSGMLLFGIIVSSFTLTSYAFLISRFSKVWVTILPIVLILMTRQITGDLVQSFLGSYYYGLKVKEWGELGSLRKTIAKVGTITTIKSPYQDIHLVTENPLKNSFSPGNFTLYLNHKPQFDFMSSPTYHESMLYGAVNLSQKRPQKILVLGGGDGILVSYLLTSFPDADLTLVELDHEMLKTAKEEPSLILLNKGVLNKKDKFRLVIDDGFNFLRNNQDLYDGIFIDFPYPYSDELLSLYSQEFYQTVKARLAKSGFIALDFPITDKREEEASVLAYRVTQTLQIAGFKALLPYGPYSSFIYGEVESRNLKFNYDELKMNLKLSTRLNLVSLEHLFNSSKQKFKPISLFYGQ